MYLPVTVAILFEQTAKEFQLSWQTLLVTDGSSSLYLGGSAYWPGDSMVNWLLG
jgi:hypothetical protein